MGKRFVRIVAAVLAAILLLSTASVLFASGSDGRTQEIHAEISDAI